MDEPLDEPMEGDFGLGGAGDLSDFIDDMLDQKPLSPSDILGEPLPPLPSAAAEPSAEPSAEPLAASDDFLASLEPSTATLGASLEQTTAPVEEGIPSVISSSKETLQTRWKANMTKWRSQELAYQRLCAVCADQSSSNQALRASIAEAQAKLEALQSATDQKMHRIAVLQARLNNHIVEHSITYPVSASLAKPDLANLFEPPVPRSDDEDDEAPFIPDVPAFWRSPILDLNGQALPAYKRTRRAQKFLRKAAEPEASEATKREAIGDSEDEAPKAESSAPQRMKTAFLPSAAPNRWYASARSDRRTPIVGVETVLMVPMEAKPEEVETVWLRPRPMASEPESYSEYSGYSEYSYSDYSDYSDYSYSDYSYGEYSDEEWKKEEEEEEEEDAIEREMERRLEKIEQREDDEVFANYPQ